MTAAALKDADLSAFLARRADGGASLDLLVTGARCAGCISKIEREVSGLPGVDTVRLNLSTGRLAVGLVSDHVDPARIISALERLGYPATPFDPGAASRRTTSVRPCSVAGRCSVADTLSPARGRPSRSCISTFRPFGRTSAPARQPSAS